MAFALVGSWGIVLQVDAAGGGADQKADGMPADPATLVTIKGAIALARKGEAVQASDVKESISDPVARKVVEWAILCSGNNEIDFQRYFAFISDNPGWPNIGLLRRRAEAALWKERLDPPTVRAYFDKDQPLTAQGKFALARALLLEGHRADSQNLVREAWRYDNFSGDLEAQVLDVFRDLITDADHKARMDMQLYAGDVDDAVRSANRAGGNAPVIAKARVAAIKKAADAKAHPDGVPAPRLHTSPRSRKAPAIRSPSHAPPIGRAARRSISARPTTLVRITRRRPATRPPITASSHERGSGSRTL